MPEYRAPGVYVEETASRNRVIQRASTGTCAFVGPTRSGPVAGTEPPELLTSVADFERIHGPAVDLEFDGARVPNYLAHAVRAYFAEGGRRLYVARVIARRGADEGAATCASVHLCEAGADAMTVAFHARFPGAAGNGTVSVVETATAASRAMLEGAPAGTWLRTGSGDLAGDFIRIDGDWIDAAAPGAGPVAAELLETREPRILALAVSHRDADGREQAWAGLGYDRRHPRWIGTVLAAGPARRVERLQHACTLQVGAGVDAVMLRMALLAGARADAQGRTSRTWTLAGGGDGPAPQAADYAAALEAIDALDEVSTFAAPGATALGDADNAIAVLQAQIEHSSRARPWRLAVLETPPGLDIASVRALRRSLDSRHAALYYPWVIVADPAATPRMEPPAGLALPPAGFICGIYARNDVQRGVHTAPANEVVRSALRFAEPINAAQQEVLNPEGVNCLRTLAGRGHRVWGARTLSSDPEWKYVAVRRYVDCLEASLDRGTQWAAFEPNGEPLWAALRAAIGDFLHAEWRSGALQGTKAEEAYFVRCDRSTMSQDDLDRGRMVCLVGVAATRPAEFVVLRISQQTAAP